MDRGSKVSEDGCNGDRNALQQVYCSRRHLTAQARVQPLANACDVGKGFLRVGLLRPSAARIIPLMLHTIILFTYNRRYIITATNTARCRIMTTAGISLPDRRVTEAPDEMCDSEHHSLYMSAIIQEASITSRRVRKFNNLPVTTHDMT